MKIELKNANDGDMEDNVKYGLTVKGLIGNDLCEIMKKYMASINKNAIILEDNELKWITVKLTTTNKD